METEQETPTPGMESDGIFPIPGESEPNVSRQDGDSISTRVPPPHPFERAVDGTGGGTKGCTDCDVFGVAIGGNTPGTGTVMRAFNVSGVSTGPIKNGTGGDRAWAGRGAGR